MRPKQTSRRSQGRGIFSELMERELHGPRPKRIRLNPRCMRIEDMLDSEGLLKRCVLLGFLRSGDFVISYSHTDGEFALELWHFRLGEQVALACRADLFRADEGPGGGEGAGPPCEPLHSTLVRRNDSYTVHVSCPMSSCRRVGWPGAGDHGVRSGRLVARCRSRRAGRGERRGRRRIRHPPKLCYSCASSGEAAALYLGWCLSAPEAPSGVCSSSPIS